MSEIGDYGERLRRWGWVSVAIGLPGAGLLGWEGYLMFVDFHEPSMGEVFMVFALMAPLLVGARMIMSGYRLEASANAETPREGPGPLEPETGQSETRATVFRPAFLLGVAVFLTGLGYMAVPVCGCSTREKAYEAAMKSDLKNLASQQEIYFSDEYAYSTSTRDLAFTNSDGVTIRIVATQSGWTANAWHAALGPDVGCAMYYGEVDFVLRTGGGTVPTEEGQYACDEF